MHHPGSLVNSFITQDTSQPCSRSTKTREYAGGVKHAVNPELHSDDADILSVAVPVIATTPETVAPEPGERMVTDGAIVSVEMLWLAAVVTR